MSFGEVTALTKQGHVLGIASSGSIRGFGVGRRAQVRYAAEADYATWQHRLHVVGLDLRDVGSVEAFCQFMAATFGSVDIVVNNACQTVRHRHRLSLSPSLGAVLGMGCKQSLNAYGRRRACMVELGWR